jgi:TatA/E family protein of Tat protein translocase
VIGDILQPTHLLFILVVALLVLGPKRLPEVGRALGRGLRDFRNALNTDELRDQMISTTSVQSTPPVTQEPTEQTETAPPTEAAASTLTTDPDLSGATAERTSEPGASTPSPEPAASASSPDRAP